VSNYLPIFYFLFILSILVVINFTTRIVISLFGNVEELDKNKISKQDKIYFALAFSFILTFIKFS
jgi:hypothetical protein